MEFEFATSTRIIFGKGVVQQVGGLAAGFGKRAFVVTGGDPARASALLDLLQKQGLETATFAVRGEPTMETARLATEAARQARAEVIIGFGGGSPLDTAKTVAAVLGNGGDPLDYAEVIGRGRSFAGPSTPFVAIPTTAGTGSETTRNAVLSSAEHRVKVSLRSLFMLPAVALVDPELTYTMPPRATAFTGMDALTQLLEPYVSRRANPMTDGLCLEGMRRAGRSLRRAFQNGQDAQAREDMALAGMLSGITLANGGLGAVHGIAGPFGGMYPQAPHGALCAVLLPAVTAVNLRACREQSARALIDRYTEIARVLTGDPRSEAEAGVEWIQALCHDLGIPPLRSYGLIESEIPTLIEKSAAANSMRSNPVTLSSDELRRIVDLAG